MAGEAGARSEGGLPGQWTSRDVAGVLFRRKGATFAFFTAAGVAVAAYVVLAPEVYRSEAKLLVKIGRESVALDPTATTGRIISVARSRMNEINSELEILRSRDLAEGVVDALGPERILRPGARPGRMGADGDAGAGALRREKAVRAVLDALDISVVKDSNVIAASFEAADPELAREVLRKLMALYLDRHIAVHRTSGSHSFFAAETEKRRASLDRIETGLRDLKNETGVASLEDQREILSLHV
ncbi:MAG: Wzz/FepE/Etk N-terminal domain-containing protein, partial [Planctomycetota bacterium]